MNYYFFKYPILDLFLSIVIALQKPIKAPITGLVKGPVMSNFKKQFLFKVSGLKYQL